MERLAIIDHEAHKLFVEDVSEEDLAKYNGEEEAYIKDNYTFKGNWSWDYITDASYFSEECKFPVKIDFENLEEPSDEPLEIWDGGYTEEELEGYEVVTWPESQELMERRGFRENCYLVNDMEGYDIYGSAAYVCPTEWLHGEEG